MTNEELDHLSAMESELQSLREQLLKAQAACVEKNHVLQMHLDELDELRFEAKQELEKLSDNERLHAKPMLDNLLGINIAINECTQAMSSNCGSRIIAKLKAAEEMEKWIWDENKGCEALTAWQKANEVK